MVVGENYFADANGSAVDYGEVFKSDPISRGSDPVKTDGSARKARCEWRHKRPLDALESAARTPNANVVPYLIECCHAYATVGEMVARLKACWGEFSEPIRL